MRWLVHCSSNFVAILPEPCFQAPLGYSMLILFPWVLVTIATFIAQSQFVAHRQPPYEFVKDLIIMSIHSATRFTRTTLSRLIQTWTSVRFLTQSKYDIDKASWCTKSTMHDSSAERIPNIWPASRRAAFLSLPYVTKRGHNQRISTLEEETHHLW